MKSTSIEFQVSLLILSNDSTHSNTFISNGETLIAPLTRFPLISTGQKLITRPAQDQPAINYHFIQMKTEMNNRTNNNSTSPTAAPEHSNALMIESIN